MATTVLKILTGITFSALVIVLAIVGVQALSQNEPTQQPAFITAAPASPPKADKAVDNDADLFDMPLGTEVHCWEGTMDDQFDLTISETDAKLNTERDLYSEPEYNPIVFGVNIEHVSGTPTPYDSVIYLQTTDGSIYNAMPIYSNSPHWNGTGHDLFPGEKREGLIWFDVPAGQTPDKLLYAPGGASNISGSWAL